jgi:hypothetical protein
MNSLFVPKRRASFVNEYRTIIRVLCYCKYGRAVKPLVYEWQRNEAVNVSLAEKEFH